MFITKAFLIHDVHLVFPTCPQNPCRNGGSCQLVSNIEVCLCPKGYTGNNCEIGECKSVLLRQTINNKVLIKAFNCHMLFHAYPIVV